MMSRTGALSAALVEWKRIQESFKALRITAPGGSPSGALDSVAELLVNNSGGLYAPLMAPPVVGSECS